MNESINQSINASSFHPLRQPPYVPKAGRIGIYRHIQANAIYSPIKSYPLHGLSMTLTLIVCILPDRLRGMGDGFPRSCLGVPLRPSATRGVTEAVHLHTGGHRKSSSKAARGTSMWPHGWRRGKPVKSTIFWIPTRTCIRHPSRPRNGSLSLLASAPRAEGSRLRAHNG